MVWTSAHTSLSFLTLAPRVVVGPLDVKLAVGLPMVNKRTHIVIPAGLVAEIDRLVGKRARSRFLTDLAAQELRRLRLLKALGRSRPAWKPSDHAELKKGSEVWIRRLRRQDEARFRKLRR